MQHMAERHKFTGRIYAITSDGHDGCYVGSTTKTLEKRLAQHKAQLTSYLNGKQRFICSFEIVKHEGAAMHLLHEGQFESKRDMEKLEGHFIDNTPGAVNKRTPGKDMHTNPPHTHANPRIRMRTHVTHALQETCR